MPNSVAKLYAAPRRFNVATIMIVTIAYALLFSALRMTQSPPSVFVAVAGFITCVGIGQALLFRGERPRMSSVLVGVVCHVGIALFGTMASIGRPFNIVFTGIWPAVNGAIFGYLAGVAVGSVFLLSDMVRKLIRWCKRR